MEKRIFVSPSGNDANPGTLEKPIKTLYRAKELVLEAKAAEKGDITVLLRGGEHRLDKTLILNIQDGGDQNRRITYRAFDDEKPIITSGLEITGWKKLNTDIPYLQPTAKNNVYVADLPIINGEVFTFKTLYQGTKRLNRARSAGFDPVENYMISGKGDPKRPDSNYTMHYKEGTVRNWANLRDVEMIVRPTAQWLAQYMIIDRIDEQEKKVYFKNKAVYAIGKVDYGGKETCWVENSIEYLTKPGDWCLDSQAGKLYLWPLNSGEPESITAPLLKEYIRVEGEIDYDGPVDKPVHNISFIGLTFANGDRMEVRPEHKGRELQHEWDLFDAPNAMLRLRGAEGCQVKDCILRDSGGTGLRLDLHCIGNTITGNWLEDIGWTGILLAGYGPGTKNCSRRNVVENNYVTRSGSVVWHGIGIYAWLSGENIIRHNLVHNTPYTGIACTGRVVFTDSIYAECGGTIRKHELPFYKATYGECVEYLPYLHGRENIIEYNEVYDSTQILFDGNGIYISGTGIKNLCARNFVHHQTSDTFCEAIRCDDWQYEAILEGNIIYKCGGDKAVGITIKAKNDVLNNLIADPGAPNKWGMLSLEGDLMKGATIKRNVIVGTIKENMAVTEDKVYCRRPARLQDTDADYNLYYNVNVPGWGQAVLDEYQPKGVEKHSIAVDPKLFDINTGDLRLKHDSPAFGLGFKETDMSKCGLTADFGYDMSHEPIGRVFVKSGCQVSTVYLNPSENAVLEVVAKTVTGFVAKPESYTVRFTSTDEKVVSVNELGVIHAVAAGFASVNVELTRDGKLCAKTYIDVIVK